MESRKALIDYIIGNEFISKPELQQKFIELLDKYAKALQLLQTDVISCLSDDDKLKIAWVVLEWVGYERGFEFDDDNIMEVLRQNSL